MKHRKRIKGTKDKLISKNRESEKGRQINSFKEKRLNRLETERERDTNSK